MLCHICYVFKTAKRIPKTNQDVMGERCIKNNDVVLAVKDEDQKIYCKS